MSERENIKLVVLDSGEHIIGTVTESEDSVLIELPVVMAPDPSSGGRRMGFMAYLQFCVEEQAEFPRRTIRHILTPIDDLLSGYIQQYGSGLVTPANDNIILS